MKKQLTKSLLVLFFGILIPELIADLYSINHYNNFRFTLQYITGMIIFASSLFILVFNFRGLRSSIGAEKYQRIIFLIISFCFLVYISAGLITQFMVGSINIG